ncbi:hypothetical protein NMY22_g6869 [Coprinellus aureogranulatus]|nr:hypothetical protein NMY22_g6869 [Coprinellus aureogranulatus]
MFTFAVPDSTGYYTDKGRLLDLCLVCKDWYQAALTAQQVWGRLEIKPFSTSSPNWNVLYRWFRRANPGSRALKVSQGSVCRHMFEHTVRCVMKNESLVKLLVDGPPCNWDGPYLLLALQHCTNLRELSIDFRLADTWWVEDITNREFDLPRHLWETGITIPSLHTLSVSCIRRSSTECYLPFLELPALLHLRIGLAPRVFHVDETHPDYVPSEEAGYAVASFVRTLDNQSPNWKDSIKCLALEIPQGSRIETINSQQLVDLVSNFPSLTHLSLDHFTFELQAFVDASPHSYFPSLEHLQLRNIPGDFDLASLLECLDDWRRNGDLNSLKRVSITYARHGYTTETDKDRMKLVQKLREMGVRVDGEVEVANKALYFWPSSGPQRELAASSLGTLPALHVATGTNKAPTVDLTEDSSLAKIYLSKTQHYTALLASSTSPIQHLLLHLSVETRNLRSRSSSIHTIDYEA